MVEGQYPLQQTSVNVEFSCRAMPALFHNSPEEFLSILSRDGNRFLRFYWEESAKRVRQGVSASSFGINFEIRDPSPYAEIALVTLPQPVLGGEVFFCAFVFSLLRVSPLLFIQDRTRVFILEKGGSDTADASIFIINRKLGKEKTGAGLAPRLEEFYETVISKIREEG